MPLDLAGDLAQLAVANRNGFSFLLAYGLSWLAAAGLWKRLGARIGAYAVLFQGVAALPLAFGLQVLASGGARPDNPLLDQLSLFLASPRSSRGRSSSTSSWLGATP